MDGGRRPPVPRAHSSQLGLARKVLPSEPRGFQHFEVGKGRVSARCATAWTDASPRSAPRRVQPPAPHSRFVPAASWGWGETLAWLKVRRKAHVAGHPRPESSWTPAKGVPAPYGKAAPAVPVATLGRGAFRLGHRRGALHPSPASAAGAGQGRSFKASGFSGYSCG